MVKYAGRIEDQAMLDRCTIIQTAVDERDVSDLDSVAWFRLTWQSEVW